jgi:di/tricarboxylate transporter
LTLEAWIATAVVAVVFALLASGRVPAYLALLGGLTVLLVSGIASPERALVGFSNEGLVTIAALYVVAAGLRQTGVLGYLLQRALGRPRTAAHAQLRLAAPVIAGSAFLNNTPVVAMLLPVLKDWCRTARIAASKLMLPLSYMAILGGVCTLIGTSTNLVVNGLWIAEGKPSFGLFDIAWIGVPCALAGMLFLIVAGRWLLPERDDSAPVPQAPREYTLELLVTPGGALAGKSIEASGLQSFPGSYLMEVHRGGRAYQVIESNWSLRGGDRLVFTGVVDAMIELLRMPGLLPATAEPVKLASHRAVRSFSEAVLSPTSPAAGRRVAEAEIPERYGAAVLGVSRADGRLSGPVAELVLRPGDALLLESDPSFVDRHRNSTDFYLVSQLDTAGPSTGAQAPLALAILVAMVGTVALGVLSMLQAALVAGGAMLLVRCCSEETALKSVNWRLLLAVGAAFGIGAALEDTGAAKAVAHALAAPAGDNPQLALILFYGSATVLSELVTNNAAAVIMFPIAMGLAAELGVSAMPFIIALMIAASASFATPLGYQTNLMVYLAGGYRFSDFLKLGIPMNLIMWAITAALAPVIWPF